MQKKKKHNVKSIPAPSIPLDELVEVAECAQICSKYKEYKLGDAYIEKK
jgi:hypothetical protein